MRILRTFQHIAQIEHWCDMCCKYIEPGDCYQGSVQVWERGRLLVFKVHMFPACDFPSDPEEKRGKAEKEEMPLALAA
ncbi:MAG: hypothetical protein WC831_00995 [Parcubacteria group bacterium]|jgi:hypothetical protein